jgi:GDPmannose 4,6-dehydratase
MMSKRALITGITGQDGAYLSQLLLAKGYEVFGTYRRNASLNNWRLVDLGVDKDIHFLELELLEFSNILRAIENIKPDEVYNLAAQSFVTSSFEEPIYTGEVDGISVTRILEAIRHIDAKNIRFYQASTSEMFGKVQDSPQTEETPFYPRSPYGVAKLYGHWMTVNYREAYGMHASSGILFNHESPLRCADFVTRKITLSLARIKCGDAGPLRLGNLEAKRDWGFAGDYVDGMWRMIQQPSGDSYVLATGVPHTVREFVDCAAQALDLALDWQGDGVDMVGLDRKTGAPIVSVDPQYFRPSEVNLLQGCADKAKRVLGWEPKMKFSQLVQTMVQTDYDRVRQGKLRY